MPRTLLRIVGPRMLALIAVFSQVSELSYRDCLLRNFHVRMASMSACALAGGGLESLCLCEDTT